MTVEAGKDKGRGAGRGSGRGTRPQIARRHLTEAERALTLQLLAETAGREEIGRALGLNPNYLPEVMRSNGLGQQWADGMIAYRRKFAARQNAARLNAASPEVTDQNTRESSTQMLERLIQTGAVVTPRERPERTFEEKLQLLAEGKARLVPNIRIGRPVNAVTSAYGEAMT